MLEMGIAPGDGEEFAHVRRSIDERLFPTWKKARAMLEPYAAKYIGPGVSQAGDPVARHIFHVRKRLPEAVLLLDDPCSGKSAIASALFKSDILRVSGDALYHEIRAGKRDAPPEIAHIIAETPAETPLNCLAVTAKICRTGQLSALCALLLAACGGQSFVLDMAVPRDFRGQVSAFFEENGFFVADVSLHGGAEYREISPAACQDYIDFLSHNFLIDEEAYLRANPAVAKAVESGDMPGAQYHYWNFGRFEGRRFFPPKKKAGPH